MCAQSQTIFLDELWGPFCPPFSFGDSLFMTFQGYMDESEDGDWFTLAAIFATGMSWTWLTVDWDRCIKKWSKRMVSRGLKPLRRYHGTDCAGRNEDFDGWTETDRDDFLQELRTIVENTEGLHTVSLSLQTKELAEVFALTKPKTIKRASYQVLLQYVMLQLGQDLHSHRSPGHANVQVALFHDHTKWYDAAINSAFYELKDDPSFRYRQYFTSISPMDWQSCIPLQPADMFAFETRKQALRTIDGGELGGEIKKLLDLPSTGGSGRYFRKDNLEELKALLDEIKYKVGVVAPTPRGQRQK